MSTDYTHFSQLAFDRLFARGPAGSETLVINSLGAFVGTIVLSGALSVKSITTSSNATFTGTVVGSSIRPTGSTAPSNGMYLPSSNTLGFSTNSTQRATISSSGLWTLLNSQFTIGSANTDATSLIYADGARTQTTLTGTTQRGITSWIGGSSAATSVLSGFHSAPGTKAVSYTCGTMLGFASGSFSKGSGSTVTSAICFGTNGVPSVGTNNAVLSDTFSLGSGTYFLYNSSSSASSVLNGAVTLNGGIVGVTTNSSAVTGRVGQLISSEITSPVNFTTTGQFGDLTSISLTAGDWDVSAVVHASANTSTMTRCYFGIGTATGNNDAGMVEGVNTVDGAIPVTSVAGGGGCMAPWRVSLSSTTTYYLKIMSTYSGGTPSARGRLSARRVR